ncbi:sulfotransferase family protein [Halostreptopolyspora alba]|uniref:Sulfotransferase n=1 Tax=Halostreptopolyspora alba TaxID=2487137 RepID=A0A3N0EI36_9ACTN|nr:sulfotransferase [Nocardiopsaceae bacterium YIM 96095]
MAPPPNRTIIVLGCPRSGTTLLQLMLHSHPRIAIPPETRFVLDAYWSRREFGDLRDSGNRRALAEHIVRRRRSRFGDLGLDPERTIAEIVDGPPTLGSALGTVFRGYAHRFDKPRWGDKRPGYYQHINELVRLFPDVQIVHLIRDGRDCVGSLKNMDWYRHDSVTAMATWAEALDYGRAAQRRLGPDSYYQLYYERLIDSPEEELSALCAFLGEEFDPAMCEPNRVADVAVPERKTWHTNTHREVNRSSSGSWEKRLEPWEISLCETVLGSRLRHNGYELSGAPRAAARDLARYARVATTRRLAHRKRELRDRWWRLNEPTPNLAAVEARSDERRSTGPEES